MSTKDRLDDNESFVSRWSRKKGDIDETDSPPMGTEAPDRPSIPLNTVLPGATTGRMSTGVEADRIKQELAEPGEVPPPLTDEDMPDIESLGEGSDFTGFMSPEVSDKLRKLALRKLFAGAGFNIRDGLDDYDEDFTNFEPLGDIVTCDMKHRAEVKEEKRQRALAEAEAAEAAEKESEEKLLAEEKEAKEAADQDTLDQQDETAENESLVDDSETVESPENQTDQTVIVESEAEADPSSQS